MGNLRRQRLSATTPAVRASAFRSWVARALLVSCSVVLGCHHRDDVVGYVSALQDAGAAGAQPPPTDAGMDCSTSQLYVLLSSITSNECRVTVNTMALLVLSGFFLQNPSVSQPGEERPPSTCDLFGGRGAWFYEKVAGGGEYFLCPGNCEVANAYVAAESQRVLACQGIGD